MSAPTVGFAGLTHLGLVTAAAVAEHGFRSIGFDPDRALAARLSRGELPFSEPRLAELVSANAGRLTFTADASALAACDVVFIGTDVPTDGSGESDLKPIRDIIGAVQAAAAKDASIVVLSQVPPGFTRAYAGRDPRFLYQVETLIFGRAVERALNPERIIVGCADPKASLPGPYGELLAGFDCPILPMRFESAELAKISINICLVASISAANVMAEMCEKTGADWAEIVPALRLDRRIGAHAYLTPGLGIAGGNLERDIATVIGLGREFGAEIGVLESWLASSRRRRDWALEILNKTVLAGKSGAVIALLGLAYKADTDSTRNSPALALIAKLRGCKVVVYDPVVPAAAAGPGVHAAGSALEAATGADALVVMTPWAEFATLEPKALAGRMAGKTVIDPYRVFDAKAVAAAGLRYAALGVGVTGNPGAVPNPA